MEIGHKVLLRLQSLKFILNHTIAERRVTWVGDTSEIALNYIMVHKKAKEMIIDLKIDEEGDINIQTDHYILAIIYGYGRYEKIKGVEGKGKSGYKWILKDITFDNFQGRFGCTGLSVPCNKGCHHEVAR